MSRPSANPQGNATARPATVDAAPLAANEIPDPPASVAASERQTEVWVEVWTAAGAAYNPGTDSGILARYCEMIERRETLLDVLAVEGWLGEGYNGQTTSHPAARLLSDVDGRLQSLEDRLGLNPEARIRLGISLVEGRSKLEAFLSGDA